MRATAILLNALCLSLAAAAQTPAPANLTGIWLGTLVAGPQTLRLQLHLQADIPGPGRCVLDSIDQSAFGIPCSLAIADKGVTVKVPAVSGSWTGTLSADGRNLIGTWTQGVPLPLAFAREATAIQPPKAAAALISVKTASKAG